MSLNGQIQNSIEEKERCEKVCSNTLREFQNFWLENEQFSKLAAAGLLHIQDYEQPSDRTL